MVALGALVWWASKQQAPQLPHTTGEILALAGAIALYGVATVVRAERWQRLLEDEDAHPPRADTYALTVIGYTGNNVLPARAGDAIRIVLMGPAAKTSRITVAGTLVAERVLDAAALVLVFAVLVTTLSLPLGLKGWMLAVVGAALVLAGAAVPRSRR